VVDILSLVIDTIPFIAIFSVISISLNLEYGYAGLPNFGKVLPILGGAVVAGSLVPRMIQVIFADSPKTDYTFNNGPASVELQAYMNAHPASSLLVMLLGIVIAIFVGASLGYIAVLPAFRLREDYLAITLIAIAEIFRAVNRNYDPILNGTRGVSVPDPLGWLGSKSIVYLYVSSALLIASLIFTSYMLRTPFGRALRAMRENELAAESLGINTKSLRIRAMVVGSAIAAAAGYIDTMYSGGLTVDKYDRYLYTFIPWLMVLMGGAGNNLGVIIGVSIYWVSSRAINFYKDQILSGIAWILNIGGGSIDISWLDVTRIERLGFAVVIILILYLRPQGILPEKPIETPGYGYVASIFREGAVRGKNVDKDSGEG
jgi:branched-chain amino acid transport system permease protein